MQVSNDSAIAFYKKFGFEIIETKEHYYKRIEPADAHVLSKSVKGSGQPAERPPTPVPVVNGTSSPNGKNSITGGHSAKKGAGDRES